MKNRSLALRWVWRVAIVCLFQISTIHVYASGDMTSDEAVHKFLIAVEADDVDQVQRFINTGTPVDSRDGRGRTALLIAANYNSVNTAKILIAAGADVNAMDNQDDSPFLYAGAEGRLEILKMTVISGADLGSLNRFGGTALIPAAHHGHVETVRYLLTTKINLDHVNKLGWTALLEAVILGNGGPVYQKIVKLLLEAGANATIADYDGVTPLQHAQIANKHAIINLLR